MKTEVVKNRLMLVGSLAVLAGFSACSSEPVAPTDPCASCTEEQVCEDGVCVDKPVEVDPCASCTEAQICVDGACKDLCGGQVCKDTQQCTEGICKDLCGSVVCGDEQICDKDNAQCVDKPVDYDPCAECTDKEECINDVCTPIDPCLNKTCPDNFRCDSSNGECVEIDPCESVICGEAQKCVMARCIDEACLDAEGAEKDCGEGKVCAKGECVDDGCQEVVCDEGWQCIKGICEETACIGYFCEEGRSCQGGACVDNECLDMTCDEGMICSKGNCTYEACLDKEPCTTGKSCNAEGVCVFDVAPALSIEEPEDKETDESGDTLALTVHLNNMPTQEVRLTCEIVTESPNKEVEAACENIVFNSENWSLGQTILVTGVEDYMKDGDQAFSIKVTSVCEDADFNALTAESVALTNLDKTQAGFLISESVLTTYEDQTQEPATFTVQLTSIPKAEVLFSLASSDLNEGIASPKFLTFTPENWNVPQTVSVKGVDDDILDRNVNYTVFFAPADSTDPDYAELMVKAIKVTNVDNDVAGLNINIPAEEFVVEEGQEYKFLVKLNTRPKNDVKVTLAVDDASEASLSVNEVTLTPETWNTGVEVTLTGELDYVIDGDQPIQLTFNATSDDVDYALEPVIFAGTVKDMDIAGVVPSMGDSPIVKEGNGDFVTMSITLLSQPTSKVTIDVSVTDSTEIKVNKKTFTMTPDYWDVPVDILVNSVDDQIVDGNVKSKVVMTMSSSDKNFNGVVHEVEFTTVDNDVAGFIISSNAGSFSENSSATSSMTVKLASQPMSNVSVAVTSSDATELSIQGSNTLTFTSENWNKAQTVNVKVMDDNIADGTQTAYVKFQGSSEDANFNGFTGQSALYTIIDNEMPSVVLTTAVTTIPQASNSTDANVVLGVQPSSNVKVTLSSTNPKVISFSPDTVTFTPSDWDQPKTVKVTADFANIASASSSEVISAIATGDAIYSSIVSNKIALNLIKVPEVQDFTFTGEVQTVDLPKGKYKLEVWGAQGGYNKSTTYLGAMAGYSVGTISLANTTKLYIYVGGEGSIASVVGQKVNGGFNGGGFALAHNWGRGSGGGATDIRVGSDSLYSRVIVAGGGGGNCGKTTAMATAMIGGHGGGVEGGVSPSLVSGVAGAIQFGSGGTQTAGGTNQSEASLTGAFGQGGNSTDSEAGGGGGWYGGAAGNSAGGGSGYVYTSSTAANYPAGCTLNTSHYLTNSQSIAGNVAFPAPVGSTETGHPGNGYARITLVKE